MQEAAKGLPAPGKLPFNLADIRGSVTSAMVEDDGETFDFERGAMNRLTLSWTPDGQGKVAKSGDYKGASRYTFTSWEKVPLTPAK